MDIRTYRGEFQGHIAFWVAAVAGAFTCAVAATAVADSRSFSLMLVVGAVAGAGITTIVLSHCLERDALSPLGLIALFYITTFVFGGVYSYITPWPGGPQPYQPSNVVQAVGLAALGFPMLALGYWTNAFRVVLRAIPKLPSKVHAGRDVVTLIILLLVGWAARTYVIGTGRYFYNDVGQGISTSSSWLLVVLATLPLLATAYAGTAYYLAKRAGASYRRARWQYYALLLSELAFAAPTGSRAAVLTVMMMIVVLRYYGLRTAPSLLSMAALVVVAMLVVFPFFYALRNSGPAGTAYQQDLRGNLSTTARSLVDQSPLEAWDAGVTATLDRFAGTAMVASMLHQGPESISREPGETLMWSFTGLAPRAIKPNKPDIGAFAHEFGQSLAVTAPGDLRTSVTVTPLAELYFNYRVVGVVVGMFLLGAAYRVIGDYFIGRQGDPISLAIYSASAWPLINGQEAIIAGGLVGGIKAMAVLAFVMVACSRLQSIHWRRA